MSNLAIIITGYLRMFLHNDDFTKMYDLAKKYYTNIYVICVLNSSEFADDSEKLKSYFKDINCDNVICDYTEHLDEYKLILERKLTNENYVKQKKYYLSSYKQAHQCIYDPDTYISGTVCVQQHQVKIGITILQTYMKTTNCEFDICMRTRFDSKYPENFFPHIPDCSGDIIKHLTFNEHILNIVVDEMKRLQMKDVTDLINFNKSTRLLNGRGHIDNIQHLLLSFGGAFCHNYQSLENIHHNGFNNTLYSFHDFYYFSRKDIFFKLHNWLDQSCITECTNTDLYNHYFCAESQLIIFCLNNGIDILMYSESFYGKSVFVNRSNY